ncbi:MAG: hypothetical protein BWY59_01092 [Verrucomicrobia bacterium ADurb.Bin345]|nr:MAG: hypothetical protein BWY59_01092 [Verrucomicrobia bacterium ADurb.Bin345]
MFVRWYPNGPGPKSSVSTMNESQRTGSHQSSCTAAKAHRTFFHGSPVLTQGFSNT